MGRVAGAPKKTPLKATPRSSRPAMGVPKSAKPTATKRSGGSLRSEARPLARSVVSSRRPAMGAGGPSLGSRGTQPPSAGRPAMAGSTRPASRGASASARPGSRVGRPAGEGSRRALGAAFKAAVAVAALALVGVVVLVVLSALPVFTITGIEAQASEHVSEQSIARLAAVDEGTTLLNVDVGKVKQNVSQNPWVKSVKVTRLFPDHLGVSVEERQVKALCLIGSGSSAWLLGDDGVWIEPVQLSSSESQDLSAAALAKAQELGCLLIQQLPSTVEPTQGSVATDDTIKAVLTFQNELSSDISGQARVYNAASEGSISVVLDSGLEVSLGTPTDIANKQAALTEVMNTYPGQLTYVNVRVPSKPTYRRVSADSVQAGS